MKHNMTKNFSLKLLSLVVAFLIWLFVVNIDNPTKSVLFRDVKIQVVNEDSVTEIDKIFDIVSDDTVVIKVTERRNILSSLTKDDFIVIADMENLNDMNTVPLTVTCSNSAVTWDEMEIVPSSMKVKLEQKKQSDFVVNVLPIGTPEKGFEVGTVVPLQDTTVQIAGPERMINRISQVVAQVNVNRLKKNQRLLATLKLIDKDGEEFTDAQMNRIQIKDSTGVLLSENVITVDVTMWKVMTDIPIDVEVTGEPPYGYRLAGVSTVPTTANLVGTTEALASLNGKLVLTDPILLDGVTESFTQEIDLTDTLSEYEDIRLMADSESKVVVTVQIEATGDQTLTIPLSSLEVLNRPENRQLTFSPADMITISVHSDNENSIIQLSDIKASIDLGVCAQQDTSEVPVKIELPEGYSLNSEVYLVVTAEDIVPQTEMKQEQNQKKAEE